RTFGTFASGRRTGGQHEERRCQGQPGLRKAAHVTSCAIAATCRPSAGAAATLRAKSRPSSPFPDRGPFCPGALAIPAPERRGRFLEGACVAARPCISRLLDLRPRLLTSRRVIFVGL